MSEPISFEWSPADIAMFGDYVAEQELLGRRREIGRLENADRLQNLRNLLAEWNAEERLTITEAPASVWDKTWANAWNEVDPEMWEDRNGAQ